MPFTLLRRGEWLSSAQNPETVFYRILEQLSSPEEPIQAVRKESKN